ncbi:sigma-54 dependent transcriptional regulator [Burkholderia sola]|uniref:sigma 54-interacting transcriptional regulator n=1 Tax=Burkholderia TaxID=32008 RepID=UPI001AE52549|nr:sigma-54 dependent transcriptional regulator [Burkholderia sp. AcTa6-5]MBP0714313.1 sigma-54-dependent Fis family transcriptional regulator [Burkholderia sp. AcTa6-5]
MTHAVHLDPLAVAGLARDLTWATTPAELAMPLLKTIVESCGLSQGVCYCLNSTGDQLQPLASFPKIASGFPDQAMSELDNPLVYGLVGCQPCTVERIDALVNVGTTFESLREHLPMQQGALVLPLRDTNRRAFAVLALFGEAGTLRELRHAPLWQTLMQIHEHLFARLNKHLGDEIQARHARADQAHANARSRERAARLLATEFVGTSAAARQLRDDMLGMLDSALAILITGETGAGKDHAAWLIHQASSRGGRFVPVNCAAIPKELIEAELFGSERGAFTGASQARKGLVAEADGGTLFLDEIGDMPLELQGRLLRVLNEKKYRPVGANQERRSDFRLICATHQPLPQRIAEGRFREDLYFRIRQQTLHVPALRERPEDIAVLAEHTLLQYNRECQVHIPGFSASALSLLQAHSFPGNVRELRSLVLVAAERTKAGQSITPEALRGLQPDRKRNEMAAELQHPLHDLWHTEDLPEALAAFESRLIDERLRLANGSRTLAARSLGIPKRTLARKCLKWNLDREDSTT